MSAPSDAETPCAECGMPTRRSEFHPYIACLAFEACQSSKQVRENLNALAEYIRTEEREACARELEERAKQRKSEGVRAAAIVLRCAANALRKKQS